MSKLSSDHILYKEVFSLTKKKEIIYSIAGELSHLFRIHSQPHMSRLMHRGEIKLYICISKHAVKQG